MDLVNERLKKIKNAPTMDQQKHVAALVASAPMQACIEATIENELKEDLTEHEAKHNASRVWALSGVTADLKRKAGQCEQL